jgi:hypothetical protein
MLITACTVDFMLRGWARKSKIGKDIESTAGEPDEAPVYKTENTAVGILHADHVAPSILAEKRRSLGRYSSLADPDHGV